MTHDSSSSSIVMATLASPASVYHSEPLFFDRAKYLGHDLEQLRNGDVVSGTVYLNSLSDFKGLFAADIPHQFRVQHSLHIQPKQIAPHLSETTRLMYRLSDHIFGDAPLLREDTAHLSNIFPITIQALSALNHVVDTDEVYGPSGAPVLLNFGTLTFKGGSITTRNTVLTLRAETLIFDAVPGHKPYHIGILGEDGAMGKAGKDGTSAPGQANAGADRPPSSPGICNGVGNGGQGSAGADGGDGVPGEPGDDGLPSLPAHITFMAVSPANQQSLVVYTRSGSGGSGGPGGKGGDGQQGGRGGKGCDSGCQGTNGGNGGNGGTSGNGGDGGTGGNGVDGQNMYVTVPRDYVQNVITTRYVAPYGQGGIPGQGGNGGAGGYGGVGGKHSSNGNGGTHGNGGNPGTTGKTGTLQGTPGTIYVNGI